MIEFSRYQNFENGLWLMCLKKMIRKNMYLARVWFLFSHYALVHARKTALHDQYKYFNITEWAAHISYTNVSIDTTVTRTVSITPFRINNLHIFPWDRFSASFPPQKTCVIIHRFSFVFFFSFHPLVNFSRNGL